MSIDTLTNQRHSIRQYAPPSVKLAGGSEGVESSGNNVTYSKSGTPRSASPLSTSASSIVSSATSVSSRNFPADASQYKILSEIGVGQYSNVWRALCIPLDEQVAIKIIDLERYNDTILDDITKEINIMSSCSHENVVKFYASFVHGTSLYIVTELLEGGSIYDLMRYKYPNGLEDEDLIASILKQTLKALDYFHSNGHIHRHVKCSNILVDSGGRVRIADFGVSARLIEGGDRRKIRQTLVGSPCWMAPEVMEQLSGYDYKADIWSFGITAIEMARGKAPLQDFPPMKVMLLTLNSPPPTLDITDKRYSKQFKDMIDLCLKKSPGRRPTAQQLLRHRFFTRAKSPEYVRDKLLYNMIPLDERVIILKRLREQEEERLLQEQQEKQQQQQQQQQQDEGIAEEEARTDGDTPVSGRKPPSGWDWGDIKHADQKPRQSMGKETSQDGSTQEQPEENTVPGLALSVPSRTSSRHASVEGSPQSPRNGADAADFSDTAIRETASRSSITSSAVATPQSVVSPISEPSKTLKRVETRGRFVVETIKHIDTRKDQTQQQEQTQQQAQQQASDQPLSSASSPSDVESTSSTQPQKTVRRKGRFTVEEVETPQKMIPDQQQPVDTQEQRQRQRQQQSTGIDQQPARTTEDDTLRMQTSTTGGQHKVKKRRSGRKFDIKDVNEADLQARKSSSTASSPMHAGAQGASGVSSKKPVITSSIEKQLKELATQSQQQLKIINALFQMTKDRDSLFSHKYASDNTDCVDLIGRLESRVKHVLDENETLRQENEKLIIELNKYKRREKQRERQQTTDSISSLTHTASTPTSTPGSTSTSDSEGSSLQT